MRPADYSIEKIIRAGKLLLERDIAVTQYSLHKELGGGNPKRLIRVWQEHLEKNDDGDPLPSQIRVEAQVASNRMAALLKDELEKISLTIYETATAAVAAAFAEQAQKIKSLEAQLAVAEQRSTDLERENEKLDDQIQSLFYALKAMEDRETDREAKTEAATCSTDSDEEIEATYAAVVASHRDGHPRHPDDEDIDLHAAAAAAAPRPE